MYYRPRVESTEHLVLMRRLDALSLRHPFYGGRQMARHLRRAGMAVGRRRVQRLMRRMGLEALYRKLRTSRAHLDHAVYPYLLGDLTIDRPDQVWCADITSIPLAAGCLYLVAVMDWASRDALAWRLSNTLDGDCCLEALEALRTAEPGIFNTDQRAQFTSTAFTGRVLATGLRCSMNGRGRCLDNVFIERLCWADARWPKCMARSVRRDLPNSGTGDRGRRLPGARLAGDRWRSDRRRGREIPTGPQRFTVDLLTRKTTAGCEPESVNLSAGATSPKR